jgi:Mlc titration factor MtfA (ptsG expression regulator)
VASVTAAGAETIFPFDLITVGRRNWKKGRDREDALAPAGAGRDACATQGAQLCLECAMILELLRQRRRRRLRARSFPEKWLTLIQRHVVIFHRLSASDRAELLGHIQIFLAEKRFEGCDGFAITDEVRVTIAAQACLLLLHRKTDYFPQLLTILVYPLSYMVDERRQIAEHVWEEGTVSRLGETGRRMGSLVLSWGAVKHGAADPSDGKNVVLHEFAHQLDFENDAVDGVPALATREQQLAWTAVMRSEFASLRAADESGVPTLLDTYGATDPAEFFAVSVEAFFEQPHALRSRHSKLYAELRNYFQQDPIEFFAEAVR